MTAAVPAPSAAVTALLAALDGAPDARAARPLLTALLVQPDPLPGLRALEARGALARWLPVMAALRGVHQLPGHAMDVLDHSFRACAGAPPHELNRWTALLHDCGKGPTAAHDPDGRRRFFGHETVGAALVRALLPPFGFDPAFSAAVALLIEMHLRPLSYTPRWTVGAILRLQAEAGPWWPDLIAQCQADLHGYWPESVAAGLANLQALVDRAARLAHPPPPPPGSPLDGDDLQALFHRPPGPWLRPLKAALAAAVHSGRLAPDDRAGAAALAAALVGAVGGEGGRGTGARGD